jgi:hypothetical protein
MQPIRKLALVAALATVTGITGAIAQPGPQPGYMMGPGMMGSNGMMGGGMHMGMMGWGGQATQMCTMMTGHVEGRLAYLKAELKITPAQETLWTPFADAVRANAQTMAARCNAMVGGQPL